MTAVFTAAMVAAASGVTVFMVMVAAGDVYKRQPFFISDLDLYDAAGS